MIMLLIVHFETIVPAAQPLKPDGLKVSFDKYSSAVLMEWKEPFTHLPQFPILGYLMELQYLSADHTVLKTETLAVSGAETKFSQALNESDLCSSSRVCVTLRAWNKIGESHETKSNCTNIERGRHHLSCMK